MNGQADVTQTDRQVSRQHSLARYRLESEWSPYGAKCTERTIPSYGLKWEKTALSHLNPIIFSPCSLWRTDKFLVYFQVVTLASYFLAFAFFYSDKIASLCGACECEIPLHTPINKYTHTPTPRRIDLSAWNFHAFHQKLINLLT